jgi:arylsulfatase A-like enzyme
MVHGAKWALVAAAAAGLWAGPVGAGGPVNVVMIVADDMGYADLGVTGCKDFATPHLDSIAKSGVRFTQSYVTAAVCSPSRAGFLTGQYQQRFGHQHNGGGGLPFGLPTDQKLMSDHFRAAGYSTGLVGKWHLGEVAGMRPQDRGFDRFVGHLQGGSSFYPPEDYTDPKQNNNLVGEKPANWKGYLTTYFGEQSVEFIRDHAEKPFFLYLSFNAPHTPMHPREADMAGLSHIQDERRRKYASMMMAMDEAVGMVLAELKAKGLDDNTMVVFFSDNGGPQTGDPSVNGSSNRPLRSGKAQTFEGGIRVPMLMSLPGVIAAESVYDKPVSSLDLLPTFMAAIGKSPIEGVPLDGVNLLPYLSGEKTGRPHERLYWKLGASMAMVEGDYKIVYPRREGGLEEDGDKTDFAKVQLYDLSKDPSERTNLAESQPEKVQEMWATWQAWEATHAKPLWGTWKDRPKRPAGAATRPAGQ